MERWRRAFAEKDKDFKELFGVKKEIFIRMHDILTAAARERRKKGIYPLACEVTEQV